MPKLNFKCGPTTFEWEDYDGVMVRQCDCGRIYAPEKEGERRGRRKGGILLELFKGFKVAIV
jgi:hypothetical protein